LTPDIAIPAGVEQDDAGAALKQSDGVRNDPGGLDVAEAIEVRKLDDDVQIEPLSPTSCVKLSDSWALAAGGATRRRAVTNAAVTKHGKSRTRRLGDFESDIGPSLPRDYEQTRGPSVNAPAAPFEWGSVSADSTLLNMLLANCAYGDFDNTVWPRFDLQFWLHLDVELITLRFALSLRFFLYPPPAGGGAG
jgi:hypothetical protein